MGPKRRTPSKSPRRDSAAKKPKESETKRGIEEVDDVEDEEILTPKKPNRGSTVNTDSRGRSKSPAPVAASATTASPAASKSKKQTPKSSGKNSKVNTPVKSDTIVNDGGSPVRTKAVAQTKSDINTIKLKSKISLYNIKSSRKRYSDQIWEDEEELSSGNAGLIVVIISIIAFFYFCGAKIDLIELSKLPYKYLESIITKILGYLSSKATNVSYFKPATNALIGHLASFMINTYIFYTVLFIPIVYYLVEKDHTSTLTYLVFTLVVFVGLSYYHHKCVDLACFQKHADNVLARSYVDAFGVWFTSVRNIAVRTVSSLIKK
jgi:hypothetical protein